MIQNAEALTRNSPRSDAMPRFMSEKVQFWLLQGNLSAAKRWAREKEKQPELSLGEQIAIARVELAIKDAKRLDQTLRRLASLRSTTEEQGQSGLLIEILLIEALIHQVKRNHPDALRALTECVVLAEPEQYVRLFLDAGKSVFELLSMALDEGIAPEYVSSLIDAFKQDDTLKQPLVDPLSTRELEVLRLLNDGASNGAIAEKLVIAVGTVKRHTLKIYQKLGVSSRTQAIAKARELNIL
jgi:LuxR family maltose regulon positive regulatory protein